MKTFRTHVVLKMIGTLLVTVAIETWIEGGMLFVDVLLTAIIGGFLIALGMHLSRVKTEVSIPALETDEGILLRGVSIDEAIA